MKLVIEDADGTRSVVPFSGGELTVGRAAEGNAFRLADRNVSRHHARFQLVNGAASVEDLGSLGGTRVNGERIGGRRRLREGDLVEIGDYDLAVVADEGLAEVAGPGAPPPLPGPPAAPPPAAAAPPRAAPLHPAPAPALARPPPPRLPAPQPQPALPRPDARPPAHPLLLLAACLAALAVGALLGLAAGGATAPRPPAAGVSQR
jgi:predicted component of type VI protein secretion system